MKTKETTLKSGEWAAPTPPVASFDGESDTRNKKMLVTAKLDESDWQQSGRKRLKTRDFS